ncbi:MAG: hypothetical protein ABR549_11525 [Mycobacteriales bacterium]
MTPGDVMTYRLQHPISGTIYADRGDRTVEVSRDGVTGVFDMTGRWMSGELRVADPEMIRWVSTHGYTVASRHRVSFGENPAHDASVLEEGTA